MSANPWCNDLFFWFLNLLLFLPTCLLIINLGILSSSRRIQLLTSSSIKRSFFDIKSMRSKVFIRMITFQWFFTSFMQTISWLLIKRFQLQISQIFLISQRIWWYMITKFLIYPHRQQLLQWFSIGLVKLLFPYSLPIPLKMILNRRRSKIIRSVRISQSRIISLLIFNRIPQVKTFFPQLVKYNLVIFSKTTLHLLFALLSIYLIILFTTNIKKTHILPSSISKFSSYFLSKTSALFWSPCSSNNNKDIYGKITLQKRKSQQHLQHPSRLQRTFPYLPQQLPQILLSQPVKKR